MDSQKQMLFIALCLPHLTDFNIKYICDSILDKLEHDPEDRRDYIKNPVQVEMIHDMVFREGGK